MMDPTIVAALIAALAGGGAFTAIVNTIAQRRNVGANATAVVTAAARELVDPLRKELANERAEHAEEVEMERRKVRQVRSELDSAMAEARNLRVELATLRQEMDAERAKHREEMQKAHARIRELEAGAS